jgi:hypothetical protein
VEVRGDRASLRSDDSDAMVAALVHNGRSFANLEVTSAPAEPV